MLRNNADARRCSYFELGLPVVECMYIVEHNLVKFGGGRLLMLELGHKKYSIPGKGGF